MTLVITGPNQAHVEYDYEEVHAISVGLLQALESNHVTIDMGAAGAALVVGRLMSPGSMSQDECEVFLTDLFGWIGAYFTEGGLN